MGRAYEKRTQWIHIGCIAFFYRRQDFFYVLYPLCIFQCSGTRPLIRPNKQGTFLKFTNMGPHEKNDHCKFISTDNISKRWTDWCLIFVKHFNTIKAYLELKELKYVVKEINGTHIEGFSNKIRFARSSFVFGTDWKLIAYERMPVNKCIKYIILFSVVNKEYMCILNQSIEYW